MALLFANNASTVLAQGISATDTSLEVSPSTGAAFPSPEDEGDYYLSTLVGVDASLEIIKVTARDQDTFTIERAQEGTTAKAFATGSIIENRLTAGSLKNLLNVTYASEDEVLAGTEANKAISPKTLKVTYNIGTEAAPNGIPMADSAGKIDPSWLPYGLATTLAPGMVERATDQEAIDGTDTERYITPAHMQSIVSDRFSSNPGAGASPVADENGRFKYTWLDIDSFPVSERTIEYIKTSNSSWTAPATSTYLFTLIGGGGAGSNGGTHEVGGGGGGAGYIRRVQAFLTKGSTAAIVVGGAGGSSKVTIDGDPVTAPAGKAGSLGSGGNGSSGGGAGGGGVEQNSTQDQGGAGGGSGGGSGGRSSGGGGGSGAGGGKNGESGKYDGVKAAGGAALGLGASYLSLSGVLRTAPYLNFCKGGEAMAGGAGYGAGGGGKRIGGPWYSGGGGGGGIVGDGLLNNSTTPAANQGLVIIDYLTPVQPTESDDE